MTEYKPHELSNIFPLIEGKDFVELKEDIKAHGLREPIVLFEGKILDGRNRFRACQETGVTPVFEEYTGTDPLSFVISLNLKRRHLNESQRAMVAAKLANLPNHRPNKSGNLPTSLVSQSAAADLLNVSDRSIRSAKTVQEHGAPELKSAVESGRVSVSAAADIASRPIDEQTEVVAKGEKEILDKAKEIRQQRAEERRKERLEKISEISKGNSEISVISRKFPVIYADPPWRYEHVESESRAIENHYPTMSLDEICALDIGSISTDDCVLFLWTTSPKLEESFRVIREWGFTYRTCAVWDKEKIGMGYYFRQQHELLLVATKGNIPAPEPSARVPSVFRYPRGLHSRKPEDVYSIIEGMYPTLPKLELFCRTPKAGWSVWGNQSEAA
jgi:N6-adenosine-specific RNA methylase IME4/ParB-like chromosome segregation protein Spo0J